MSEAEPSLYELQVSAAAGDADAQLNLAIRYSTGDGLPKDEKRALDLFRQAARQGLIEAELGIGKIYMYGSGTLKNYQEGAMTILRLADKGHVEACFEAGSLYQQGLGVAKNISKAIQYYLRSAEQDYCRAQVSLALIYKDGIAVEKNPAEAENWLRRAAQLGDKQAIDILGQSALSANLSRYSVNDLLGLANAGDADAQLELAMRYFKGNGVPINAESFMKWVLKSAEGGNTSAQVLAAQAFRKDGEAVRRDSRVAAEWFSKAAAKGESRAEFELSSMMASAEGLGRDLKRARELLLKAAEHGELDALLCFGCLLVMENKDLESSKYLQMASDRGSVQAAELLKAVRAKDMTRKSNSRKVLELFGFGPLANG